jgi:hypothetical protein
MQFTFSQDIECGIVRSNFSLFNLSILLLCVPNSKHVTGEWRKLLHPQGMWHAWNREEKHRVLVGKPEGKETTRNTKA